MNRTVLVAGLGNPGKKYAGNRHNVGFMVLDHLADRLNLTVETRRWGGLYGRTDFAAAGEKKLDLVLLKPQDFMNCSGDAVCQAARFFKIEADQLLVIHDEIELPFADVRLKKGGGHKGHNGLRHIIEKCGSPDFHRLRVGVDRPQHPDVAGYVLADFSPEEKTNLTALLDKSCGLCLEWLARF